MIRLLCGLLMVFGLIAAGAAAAGEPPISRQQIERGLRIAHCDLSYDEAAADLAAPKPLGDNLLLLEIPCRHERYQSASIFFAFDPAAPAGAHFLQFRYPKIRGFEHQHSVADATYNTKTKTMTSLDRRRKTKDCGGAGEWQWSGTSFELKRYWLKVDCNGRRFDPQRHPKSWLIFPKPQKHKR